MRSHKSHIYVAILSATFSFWTAKLWFAPSSVSTEIHAEDELISPSTITVRAALAAGVVTAEAVIREIQPQIHVPAWIAFDETRLAHVAARYPGIIQEIFVHLGDVVQKGDALATIENSETLVTYTIRAPLSGTIVRQHGVRGESIGPSNDILVVGNLETVWIHFAVPVLYSESLRKGNSIAFSVGQNSTIGQISHISPEVDSETQTLEAHAQIENRDRRLLPGTFGTATVPVGEAQLLLAVRDDAFQTIDEETVIFVVDGEVVRPVVVETGIRSGDWVEVKNGLKAGDYYTTSNTFVLKAAIDNSGTGHEH